MDTEMKGILFIAYLLVGLMSGLAQMIMMIDDQKKEPLDLLLAATLPFLWLPYCVITWIWHIVDYLRRNSYRLRRK